MTDAEKIAKGLTAAQVRALRLYERGGITPLNYLGLDGRTLNSLTGRNFVNAGQITPLGLAVLAAINSETEK